MEMKVWVLGRLVDRVGPNSPRDPRVRHGVSRVECRTPSNP